MTNELESVAVPKNYFKLVQARYASALVVPRTVTNRTLVLRFDGGGANTSVFDSSGNGTYTWPAFGMTNSIVTYSWRQEPYAGTLYPIQWYGFPPFYLRLGFVTKTNGTFSGQDVFGFIVSGTFTLTP
jgi:hypothetical protein